MRTPGDPRGRRAFTLVETIAVTVIVVLMAAVAVPRLSALGTARAGVAARALARDLDFARERAMLTGERCWAVFNLGAQQYSLLEENGTFPGRSGASVITDLFSGKTLVRSLNTGDFAGVSLLNASFDGTVEVGFTWIGKPVAATEAALASTGTVTVTGGGTVSVLAATGAVSWSMP